MATLPVFDVWVCEGRICSSRGADAVATAARSCIEARPDAVRCRLLRGGCYGLCELGVNVVVRRFAEGQRLPDATVDRLTLTHGKNETVYSGVDGNGIARLLAAHLDDDEPAAELDRAPPEGQAPARTDVAARVRALRAKRRGR